MLCSVERGHGPIILLCIPNTPVKQADKIQSAMIRKLKNRVREQRCGRLMVQAPSCNTRIKNFRFMELCRKGVESHEYSSLCTYFSSPEYVLLKNSIFSYPTIFVQIWGRVVKYKLNIR